MLGMFKRQRESGCHQTRQMFASYIDGRLNAVEQDAVNYHIEVCDDCRRELESLEATVQLLHRMPVVTPTRSFTLAEAPRQQVLAPLGTLITDRAREATAALIPNTNWLRVATAAAIILLMVMVAGDLSETFYTESSLKTAEVAEIATIQENEIESSVLPEVGMQPSEELSKDTPTEATKVPQPSNATDSYRGVAGLNGAGEIVPPTTPPNAPSSEPGIVPENADATPLTFEAGQENLSDKSAYFWLRPLEITFAALALILGGFLFRKRRSSLH